jgi:hypothetical protein
VLHFACHHFCMIVCRWSSKLQQNLMELAGQADKSTAGSGQQPAAAAAAAGGGQVVSPQK